MSKSARLGAVGIKKREPHRGKASGGSPPPRVELRPPVPMSSTLSRLEKWEARLKAVFDEIDRELEADASSFPAYPRHPARPAAGATANPENDGLFDVGAAFSPGFGSLHGPGYVLQARIATLDSVSPADQAALEQAVVARLREKLPLAFPRANLRVSLDRHVYKIHGDLSLDPD